MVLKAVRIPQEGQAGRKSGEKPFLWSSRGEESHKKGRQAGNQKKSPSCGPQGVKNPTRRADRSETVRKALLVVLKGVRIPQEGQVTQTPGMTKEKWLRSRLTPLFSVIAIFHFCNPDISMPAAARTCVIMNSLARTVISEFEQGQQHESRTICNGIRRRAGQGQSTPAGGI